MCWTNLWSINSSAYTDVFRQFTMATLGTAPEPTELRINSSRLRPTAVTFTLTVNMCDCDAVIGSREPQQPREIEAESWLNWIHGLPAAVPYVSRLAVLHTWSPDDRTTPTHAKGIQITQADERILRAIGEDSLLTMDAPR